MTTSPKQRRIGNLLSGERSLSRYFKITRGFDHLGKLVTNQLPKEIQNDVTVRYYREGELGLNVNSAAIGMRIKMLSPQIIVNLAGERAFKDLLRITTRVQPKTYNRSQKRKPVFQMSEENRQLMESLAGTTKDEGLKQTLLKLADRTTSSSK